MKQLASRTQRRLRCLLAFFLPTVLMLSGCGGERKDAAQASVEQRHIALAGQSNFRDLGGYATAHGQTVKWGHVYRSGELHKLTESDLKRLQEMGIATVVSFLTPNETNARGADRVPQGVEEIALPIDAQLGVGGMIDELLRARKTGDFSKVPPEMNAEIHRALIREAREPYAELLRILADPSKYPLVFHCSHGVHRTGTAAAVLLAAIGVPWETVSEDYVLSNTFRKEEVDKRLAELRSRVAKEQGISLDDVDTRNMDAFYVLKTSYINAALETINSDYGSVENYLRDGLGLDQNDIERLRNALLD